MAPFHSTAGARRVRLGLALVALATLTVGSPLGCSSDIEDAPDATNVACVAPEIACIDLFDGLSAIFQCVDGGLELATACPTGTTCGSYAHRGFATCVSYEDGVIAPFGVEGGRCNDGTRACAPGDDYFLVCIDGSWADVCPASFEPPPSCSAIRTRRDLSFPAQEALLSCASEGGGCGQDGTYECDGQSAFRCEAGGQVHAVDCPANEECNANPDHAICGDRFLAVPDVPCFSSLATVTGPPLGQRSACAVDEGAVVACVDDLWVVTEVCTGGSRCGGFAGDVACR